MKLTNGKIIKGYTNAKPVLKFISGKVKIVVRLANDDGPVRYVGHYPLKRLYTCHDQVAFIVFKASSGQIRIIAFGICVTTIIGVVSGRFTFHPWLKNAAGANPNISAF
jgi:hypothetical protein